MEHLFQIERGWDENNPRKGRYFNEFTSDLAQEALENSDHIYKKVDGSCGIVSYDVAADELSLYQRIDTRGRDPSSTLVPLPVGKNPVNYKSKEHAHSYFMEKIVVSEGDGKKAKKNKRALLDVLERNKDALVDLILSRASSDGDDSSPLFLSVELVGTKFNQTPGVDAPVALAPHCLQRLSADDFPYLPQSLPRTFDELKLALVDSDNVAEGIVVEHKGNFWKVHSKLLEPTCTFATDKSKASPPVFFE